MRIEQLQKSLKKRPDASTGVGATPDAVQKAQRVLQVSFPKPLVAYLQRIGWMQLGGSEFFGLGEDVPPHLDLVTITRSERTETGCPIPPWLIPLRNDGAGNLYCMDVSADAKRAGQIFFWDHDLGTDQIPEKVANSWADWISDELEIASSALRPIGSDEARRFLTALPARDAPLSELVAAYRSRYGDEAADQLRSEVLELVAKHADDAALDARVRELGFAFKPVGEARTLRQLLTQIALILLS